ncbi:MAG: hypothetical protein K6G90_00435 [Clostridia bacterium]|nr:hypothetical protein [Clostridia bacterium]
MTGTKRTAFSRVIVTALVMCLALGGLFMLDGILPKAGAATYNVNVASSNNWASAIQGKSSGDIVNITLTGDITGATSLTTIPTGVTVNLNMNGHTIAYDKETTSESIYATSYTDGTYANGTYWGLIRNNGTLNISGNGTIRNKLMSYDREQGNESNAPQKLAAIVNNGTLTLTSGVNVNAYLSAVETKNGKYHDIFLYCVGIYNMGGTVTSNGAIDCGTFVASSNDGGTLGISATSSYCYGFVYGICGGNVTMTGGSVNIQTYAGGYKASATCGEKDHHNAYSVGVYSNNAKILGPVTITAKAAEYMGRNNNDTWSSGQSVSFACGVMYTGSNYPVIGGGASIDAYYEHYKDNVTITIPGSTHSFDECHTDNDPGTYHRRSVAVGGFSSVGNMTYGQHASEQTHGSGYFGSDDLAPASSKYYGEEVYRSGKTGNNYATDCSSVNKVSTSKNSHETHDSTSAKLTNGTVSTSQYVIINRYYNQTVTPANLVRASFRRDTTITASEPRLVQSSYNTGILDATATQNAIYGTSGSVNNVYYYALSSVASDAVAAGTYYNRNFTVDSNNNLTTLTNWNAAGSPMTNAGVGPQTGSTPRITIIYVNYVIKKATDIKFVTADNDASVTNLTNAGGTVTMTYTGKKAVPGTDFQVKIYDTSNQNDVTSVYTVDGTLAGHSNGKTGVQYSYISNGSTVNGLPKNAGEYEITATVSSDTVYASSGTYNRNGRTQTFTLRIEKADITCTDIQDAYTGTYGATTGKLSSGADGIVPLYSFTAKGVNNERPAGSWTVDEQNEVRNAGEYTSVAVSFAPSGADANNYNTFTKYVSITVNKRDVTIIPSVNTLTYGADPASIAYNIAFDTLADADADKEQGWEDGSSYQFLVNGQWVDYYKGLPAGTYPIKITDFAGSQDTNNIWTIQVGTATVNKATLTVKANDDTATYGDGVPNYGAGSVIYSGWTVGTDNEGSALTGALSVTTNYTQGSPVGVYTITPSGQTAANYNIEYINGSLTVGKRNITVTPDAVTGMTYGAELPAITYTYTGFYGSDTTSLISNTPTYTTPYTAGTSPVGSYLLTAVVSSLSAQNYSFTAGTRNFIVAKATPVINSTPTATIVNTQSLGEAVFRNGRQTNPNNPVTEVPGYYEFDDTAFVPAYVQSATPYGAKFVPTDSENYCEVTGLTVNLSISAKAITGTPVISGSAMVDSTLTVSLDGMNPSAISAYSIIWFDAGSGYLGTGASYTVKPADEGKKIYVQVTAIATQGFTGNASSDLTAEVIQALTPASLELLNITVPASSQYDGEVREAVVTAKSAYAPYIGDITVYYNGSTQAPKNAGTYQVTVSIGTPAKPAGGYTSQYYGPVSGLVAGTITITKRDFNLNYTASDKVYDGTTTATVSINAVGKIGSDDVAYDESRAKFNFDSAYVGTNKSVIASGLTLTGADAGNYNLVTASTRNANITKAKLNATAVAETGRVYNGSAVINVTFTGISGYKGSDSEATVQIQPGTGTAASPDAGSRPVLDIQAQLTGTSSANYELNILNVATCFVEIAQAPIAHTFPSNATIEFGKPLSEAVFSVAGSGDGTFAYENAASTIPESIGIYENYVVVFTPTDSVNFLSDSQPVRLTVTTCTVNYTVSITGTPEVGETLTASTQGLTSVQLSYLRYQWVRIASDGTYSKIPNAVQPTYTLQEADEGYTVAVLTTFDPGSPFVFADGTTSTVSGTTGIMSGATVAIKAIALSWWQKILNWFRRIIAAISGLSMTIGG